MRFEADSAHASFATTWLAIVAGVISTTACAADGPGRANAMARDSAGVEIVESHMPERVIAVPASPLIAIGGDDANTTFYGVVAVVALEDGGFVVADNGSKELRYFDAAGVHLRTAGRAGDGPGEYRQFSWVQRLGGDSLAVYDPRSRRVSLLAVDGTHAGSLQFDAVQSAPPSGGGVTIPSTLSGLFADRSGLVVGAVTLQRGSSDGRRTVNGVVLRHSFAELRHDTLVSAPLIDQYWQRDVPFPAAIVFGPTLSRVLVGQNALITTGREYEIRSYAAEGGLRRIARVTDASLRPVTAAHREAHAAGAQQEGPPTYATTLPAYSRLVAAGGGVWAVEYPAPGDSVTRAHVFDDQGVLTAVVELPASFTPHDVRGGRVYGVHRDEFGVETIHVHAFGDQTSNVGGPNGP